MLLSKVQKTESNSLPFKHNLLWVQEKGFTHDHYVLVVQMLGMMNQ